MNHVTARLQAYHDGELGPRTAETVAAHLAGCEACLAEFEALETLSALLHELPPATQLVPEDRFAAQVALRLPRDKAPTLPERTLKWGWRLTPVVLVATWASVQAAAILTSGIAALLRLGVGSEVAGSLIPGRTAASGVGLGVVGTLLDALGGDAVVEILRQLSAVGWITVVPMLFTGLTALAVCSWVAMWWAVERHALGDSGKQHGVRSKE
jgi:predicted anti-sigma-YlaC factor YlaD